MEDVGETVREACQISLQGKVIAYVCQIWSLLLLLLLAWRITLMKKFGSQCCIGLGRWQITCNGSRIAYLKLLKVMELWGQEYFSHKEPNTQARYNQDSCVWGRLVKTRYCKIETSTWGKGGGWVEKKMFPNLLGLSRN